MDNEELYKELICCIREDNYMRGWNIMDMDVLDLSAFDNILFYLCLTHRSLNILSVLLRKGISLTNEEISTNLCSHIEYLYKFESVDFRSVRMMDYLIENTQYNIDNNKFKNFIINNLGYSTSLPKYYKYRHTDYTLNSLKKEIEYCKNLKSFSFDIFEKIIDEFMEHMYLDIDTVKFLKKMGIDYKKYGKI